MISKVVQWSEDWISDDSSNPISISEPMRFSSCVSRLLSIKSSHALSERSSWSDMTIMVLRGQCRVEMDDEVALLSEDMELQIGPNRKHRIVAESDLRAVITFDARASVIRDGIAGESEVS